MRAIAVDTGGTFTDCVFMEEGQIRVLKIFSTPVDPGLAVYEGIERIAGAQAAHVRHGTTVGTNTALERKGARVAFVTTAGFEDSIAIGRQARAHLYDWLAEAPAPLVPASLRFGVPERTSADGQILRSPTKGELDELRNRISASGAESIAISLLFSFANPTNESLVMEALGGLGLPISISHKILPEFREYERGATVVMNSYLTPRVSGYVRSLNDRLAMANEDSRFDVMQSSGGTISARFAAEQPVRTVLSGPAGGVIGAYKVGLLAGFDKIVAFDMGGTSTDVSLIDGTEGGPRITSETVVAGVPLSVPMLDIHTVGAGGGSLARFDAAGILHVGPESAGANPGPICYGTGTLPTVSDANLLLGRLQAEHFLAGTSALDEVRTREFMERARGSLPTVEAFAAGIVALAEAKMEQAIRVISIERGYDPREFTLVAFGGAGPLHACALAEALGMKRVLIPAHPGALSAMGILLSDTVRDFSKTVMAKPTADLELHFREMEASGQEELSAYEGERRVSRSLDMRYAGQGYELNVPADDDFVASFHAAHQRRYGYADSNRPIEIVNVRARFTLTETLFTFPSYPLQRSDPAKALVRRRKVLFAGEPLDTGVYDRDALTPGDLLEGPAIVIEYSSTTVIPPACKLRVDRFKNLVIEVPA
jgi:N-methylhydantoinase A